MSVTSTPDRSRRHVAAGAAIALSYHVVLRQLTSRSRIIGLSLLALVAPISAFALGSSDPSIDDAVRLIASVGLGPYNAPRGVIVFG